VISTAVGCLIEPCRTPLIASVDVFLLAKNTGTSSDMIERFYGQVKLERMAKELRPEWRVGPWDGN
jgi:type IV secretory pathway protease TraF